MKNKSKPNQKYTLKKKSNSKKHQQKERKIRGEINGGKGKKEWGETRLVH